MRLSVNLNHQPFLMTREIREVRAYCSLSAKVRVVQ